MSLHHPNLLEEKVVCPLELSTLSLQGSPKWAKSLLCHRPGEAASVIERHRDLASACHDILTAMSCLRTQGGIDSAVLELYKYEADTSRGDAFPLAWEKKGVHGREAGKGLQAGVNSRGQSLAVSYSAQTDLQLFSHSGVELASINSSGKCFCLVWKSVTGASMCWCVSPRLVLLPPPLLTPTHTQIHTQMHMTLHHQLWNCYLHNRSVISNPRV